MVQSRLPRVRLDHGQRYRRVQYLVHVYRSSTTGLFSQPEVDDAFGGLSIHVWLVPSLELFFCATGRFQNLIVSDKAYAPTTVRFINGCHVCIELSLIIFISEYCLISPSAVDDRLRFSFTMRYRAASRGPRV
jgi:hypothetical protein